MRPQVLLVVFAAQAMSFAQIDRSPVPFPGGGSNGPLGIPGTRFPLPRKGGPTDRTSSEQATTHESGKLTKIDDKSLVVEARDGRTLEFQRTKDTRFYKESKEVRATEFKPGDEVAVEATQDQRGRLYARSVYLEPPAAAPAKPEADTAAAGPAPRASPRDADDPGPPVLKRGAPEKRENREAEAAPAPASANEPEPALVDAFLEKARAAASTFSEGLPNYVCKELMSRFYSSTRPANWRALDVVSMDLVYEDGRESYRNVAVNDKPTHKKVEELEGAWSTGEFASTLLDLFSPSTDADFRFRGRSVSSGVPARVYDFDVRQPNSHWHVQAESQSINPAYKGSVWIEPETGRVLRIEMQAASLPAAFPFDTVESVVEYAKVRIGSREFLLPVHAESLSCQRGTANCSLNKLDFRNYHKYEADSTIDFAAAKP
jgi:hypothetical protein